MKLPKASKEQAYLLYNDGARQHRIQACLHQCLPLVVVTQCKHNEHSGVTAKHAPALCFRTTSSRWHTASVSTFEDMEHFHLILLVFCQQVAIRKHAGRSHSTSKERGKSELRLLPHPKLKTHLQNVCVAPCWQHFGQSDQYCTILTLFQRNQSAFSISMKLQNNFTLFN